MNEISDSYMSEMIGKSKSYFIVFLKKTAKKGEAGSDITIWEHGRRNFQLKEEGIMPIVCPINDTSEFSGISIFDASLEKVKELMDKDPGVKAGIFTYEIHQCKGFPGSVLP